MAGWSEGLKVETPEGDMEQLLCLRWAPPCPHFHQRETCRLKKWATERETLPFSLSKIVHHNYAYHYFLIHGIHLSSDT